MLGSYVRASTNHRQHYFLENPSLLSSLRQISSTKSNGNANQHSFTVSYLVNNSSSNLILGFETAIKDSRVFCSSSRLKRVWRFLELGLKLIGSSTLCSFLDFSCFGIWPFNCKSWKRHRFGYEYIYIKKLGSQPGLTGSAGSRVGRVSPGQFPACFFFKPGPAGSRVDSPSRAGFQNYDLNWNELKIRFYFIKRFDIGKWNWWNAEMKDIT